MTRPCAEAPRVRRWLRLRAEELLERREKADLLGHLASCPSCREEALSEDPTLLFAPLSATAEAASARPDRGAAAEELASFSDGVRAALDVDRSRRRLGAGRRVLLLRVAAVAFLAAGAAGLLLVRRGGVGVDAAAASGTLAPSTSAPSASPAPSAAPAEALASASPTLRPSRLDGDAPPLIEAVESRGAQVYQFAADAPGDPPVVLVVDATVDL